MVFCCSIPAGHRLFRALGIWRSIVCSVVVVTSSLAGGAEAAAGGIFLCSRLLFTQDAVLAVCEVGCHAGVECVRHLVLPSIPLLQYQHLVTRPVKSGDQRSWAFGVTAHGACAVCSVNIIPGPHFFRVESVQDLNNLPHTVLIGFVTFLVNIKKNKKN